MDHPKPREAHDPEALSRYFADLAAHSADVRERLSINPDVLARPPAYASRQPLRLILLNSLAELGSPTSTSVLRAFISARYDRAIPATQFGTLAVQERRAFDRIGPTGRLVWLCNGVRIDDFRPVKRVWARSDWPLSWRVVTPYSELSDRLVVTEVICDLALREDDLGPARGPLQRLALELASDLPGVDLDYVRPDFDAYAMAAREAQDGLEGENLEALEEAVDRLAETPVRVQLFGLEPSDARRKRGGARKNGSGTSSSEPTEPRGVWPSALASSTAATRQPCPPSVKLPPLWD